MPSCVMANAQGFLAVVSTDIAQCTGFIVVTPAEYEYVMGYTQITAIEATAAFSGAYSLVFVSGFLTTYVVKVAIKLVKLL
ncbi:single-stranded DNA-binding protein [Vibrio scophthalmi]|uniref:single-stranded DNA-binding protein n=1 Tax=Vibrio scophthalmi TaxID=45658 RepID=UPI003EBA25F5